MHELPAAASHAPGVLVVGQAAEDTELLARLRRTPWRVVTARSGREALRAILSGDPLDMVLLDPAGGLDTEEVVLRLRSNPPTAATPVAFVPRPAACGTAQAQAPAEPGQVVDCISACLRATRHARHVEELGERMARHLAPQAWERLFHGPDRDTIAFDDRVLTVLYAETMLLPGFGCRGHDSFIAQVDWLAGRHGGRVDGFVFGAVVAFFDQPRGGIRMALDLQRAARELRLRIGVQTAAAAIATFRTGGVTRSALLGPATSQAACLSAAAAVGSVVVSRQTYALVREELPRDTAGCLLVEEFDGGDVAQACITPAPSEMSSFAGLGLT